MEAGMRILAWMLLVLSLAAEHAVAGGRWVKNDVTREEMARDDAACFKESQRLVDMPASQGREHRTGQPAIEAGSSTAVGEKSAYGPAEARPKTEPDIVLYRACAYARGYVWVNS
jgi:hypothetical protein